METYHTDESLEQLIVDKENAEKRCIHRIHYKFPDKNKKKVLDLTSDKKELHDNGPGNNFSPIKHFGSKSTSSLPHNYLKLPKIEEHRASKLASLSSLNYIHFAPTPMSDHPPKRLSAKLTEEDEELDVVTPLKRNSITFNPLNTPIKRVSLVVRDIEREIEASESEYGFDSEDDFMDDGMDEEYGDL